MSKGGCFECRHAQSGHLHASCASIERVEIPTR